MSRRPREKHFDGRAVSRRGKKYLSTSARKNKVPIRHSVSFDAILFFIPMESTAAYLWRCKFVIASLRVWKGEKGERKRRVRAREIDFFFEITVVCKAAFMFFYVNRRYVRRYPVYISRGSVIRQGWRKLFSLMTTLGALST